MEVTTNIWLEDGQYLWGVFVESNDTPPIPVTTGQSNTLAEALRNVRAGLQQVEFDYT